MIGYSVVGLVSKGLACSDVGVGAMVEWRDIVASVVERFLVRKLDGGDTSPRDGLFYLRAVGF